MRSDPSLMDKARAIANQLGLPNDLPISKVVEKAHKEVGTTAIGTLPAQLDDIIATLRIPAIPPAHVVPIQAVPIAPAQPAVGMCCPPLLCKR